MLLAGDGSCTSVILKLTWVPAGNTGLATPAGRVGLPAAAGPGVAVVWADGTAVPIRCPVPGRPGTDAGDGWPGALGDAEAKGEQVAQQAVGHPLPLLCTAPLEIPHILRLKLQPQCYYHLHPKKKLQKIL